jgi:hypothetical protein
MLQPADLAGTPTSPAADDLRAWLRPPMPCATYRSAGKVTAARAIQVLYPVAETIPTVLLEHVAVYRAGGAAQYLHELRRALAGCRGCTEHGRGWRIVDTRVGTPDSILVRLTETVEYGDGASRLQSTYVAVARAGNAMVVLADLGWEAGDGHESLVRALAPIAVNRASIVG